MQSDETKLNDLAFRRMEASLEEKYPVGQFVAFMGGEIVADAPDFDELHAKLKSSGRDPFHAYIVQAGYSYPKKAVILGVG